MSGKAERSEGRLDLLRRIETYRMMLTSIEDRRAQDAIHVSIEELEGRLTAMGG